MHFRNGERERAPPPNSTHQQQITEIRRSSFTAAAGRSSFTSAGSCTNKPKTSTKKCSEENQKKGDLGVRCKQKGVDAQLTWVFGGGLAEVESGGIGSRSGRKEKDNVRRGHRRFGRRQQSGDWCWTTYAAGDSGGVAAARLVRARGYSRTSTRRCRHQRHR